MVFVALVALIAFVSASTFVFGIFLVVVASAFFSVATFSGVFGVVVGLLCSAWFGVDDKVLRVVLFNDFLLNPFSVSPRNKSCLMRVNIIKTVNRADTLPGVGLLLLICPIQHPHTYMQD